MDAMKLNNLIERLAATNESLKSGYLIGQWTTQTGDSIVNVYLASRGDLNNGFSPNEIIDALKNVEAK